MLTTNQTEKVEVALSLIRQVKREVIGTDYPKAVLLTTASDACNEVLQEDLPFGHTPPKEKVWYSPESMEELLPAPTMGDRIIEALSRVAATTVVCAGLSACLSLGCWGIAQVKISRGDYRQPDFTSQGRGYLGLTMIFAATTGASLVLIAVADREVN